MHAETAVNTSQPSPASPPRLGRWATAFIGVLMAGCAGSMPAQAQSEPDDDPPARVGSVSALRGPVDASAEDGAAWEPAQINQPVTSETSLFAPPGSQAEVRIGSTSVRIDGNTQAVFSQVDDHAVGIDVAQGTVRARVRSLPSGDRFTLVADGVRAEAQGPGDYRVSYDPDRRAYTVRALSGRMKVVTPGNSFNLESGQETLIENGGSSLQLRAMGPRDDFDAWAEGRDREQDRLASARYVSPEMTGIEALDAHGRWDVVGDYGPVWYPRAVPYGWAPYRYGRWAHVRPWGWTWIDDAPWGFAPFHYGRWALIGSSWGWVPGPIVARPVWAPALVGYVGGGSGGVSVSIGFGSGRPIGWFPLGPREVYHPPYRYSPRYVRQVNVINVTTVINGQPTATTRDRPVSRPPSPGNAYRYARQPDAVTMVREEQFRGARPIGRDRLDLSPQQAAALQPVLVAPPARGGGAVMPPGAGAMPRVALPAPLPGRDRDFGDRGERGERGERDGRQGQESRPRFGSGGGQEDRPWMDGRSGAGFGNRAEPVEPRVRPAPGVQAQPGSPPPVGGARDDRFNGRRDDARFDGGRKEPRFNDEDPQYRGSLGRSQPPGKQMRPEPQMPEPARAVPQMQGQTGRPPGMPPPQIAPRPAPTPQPQAAPPQPPPQQAQPAPQRSPKRQADEDDGKRRGGPRGDDPRER